MSHCVTVPGRTPKFPNPHCHSATLHGRTVLTSFSHPPHSRGAAMAVRAELMDGWLVDELLAVAAATVRKDDHQSFSRWRT